MSTIQTPDRIPRIAPVGVAPFVSTPVEAKLARTAAPIDRVGTARPAASLTGVRVSDATGMGAALRPQRSGHRRQVGQYREFLRHAYSAERRISSAKLMVWSNATMARFYADQARWDLRRATFSEAPANARWAARDAQRALDRAIIHLDRAARGDESAKALANHELYWAESRVRTAISEAQRGSSRVRRR